MLTDYEIASQEFDSYSISSMNIETETIEKLGKLGFKV